MPHGQLNWANRWYLRDRDFFLIRGFHLQVEVILVGNIEDEKIMKDERRYMEGNIVILERN